MTAFRTNDELAGRGLLEIGVSEEGRPLHAAVIGDGPRTASLIAGCHADEPVGPETLRTLVLEGKAPDGWRFVVVPHVNPDGEARNRAWIERWPDPAAYVAHVVRELPGRDLEFGFPAMRPENVAVAEFLRAHAPFDLHMSLHGMGLAEGAMLLIERHWVDRTEPLRDGFRETVATAGLGLHDHDRKGEKGFRYIGPGFTTTPEGQAMREYFHQRKDEATAQLFHQSSMEFVRGLGGDPLCLVTELPLFVIANDDPEPGVPGAYLKARRHLSEGGDVGALAVRPLPLPTAVDLQTAALRLGLAAVS